MKSYLITGMNSGSFLPVVKNFLQDNNIEYQECQLENSQSILINASPELSDNLSSGNINSVAQILNSKDCSIIYLFVPPELYINESSAKTTTQQHTLDSWLSLSNEIIRLALKNLDTFKLVPYMDTEVIASALSSILDIKNKTPNTIASALQVSSRLGYLSTALNKVHLIASKHQFQNVFERLIGLAAVPTDTTLPLKLDERQTVLKNYILSVSDYILTLNEKSETVEKKLIAEQAKHEEVSEKLSAKEDELNQLSKTQSSVEKSLNQEIELLVLQVAQLQEELEQTFNAHTSSTAEKEELLKSKQVLEQNIAELEKSYQDKINKFEKSVENERESSTQELAVLKKELSDSNKKTQKLEEDLKIYLGKNKDISDESALLELQVAQLQEELEANFLENTKLQETNQKLKDTESTLKKKLDKSISANSKLSENIQILNAELELSTLQINQLQEELEDIFDKYNQSISFDIEALNISYQISPKFSTATSILRKSWI